jgi:hypothetical protein
VVAGAAAAVVLSSAFVSCAAYRRSALHQGSYRCSCPGTGCECDHCKGITTGCSCRGTDAYGGKGNVGDADGD